MSISVLIFRGNVVRAILAGIPAIITFLLIATQMAPLYTKLANQTFGFDANNLGTITAFTGGGHQMYSLYQGELWAVGALAGLLLMMLFTYKRWRHLSAQSDGG